MSKEKNTQTPEVATGQKLASIENGFIDTLELCKRLGICRRTVANLRAQQKLPAIQLGKLVRFHWPTIQQALLRQQQGQA
jgi:excisionase family DNA binding protein